MSKHFYAACEKPPVTTCDISKTKVDVYGWKRDKAGEMQPVKIGERDLDADIQAARCETLPEMMARMPGKNAIEKAMNAVQAGVIPAPKYEGDSTVYDLTHKPNDIVEAMMYQKKAQEAYASLPDEIKTQPGNTIEEKLSNYVKAAEKAIADISAAQKGASEDEQK